MFIPSELQFIIISFTPNSELKHVCTEWNNEITNIQKLAINTIGKLYKRVFLNYTTVNTTTEFIRYLVIHYQKEYFITYPELVIEKLDLNPELLSMLPNISDRKRSNVRDWMKNMPLHFDDWSYVGW